MAIKPETKERKIKEKLDTQLSELVTQYNIIRLTRWDPSIKPTMEILLEHIISRVNHKIEINDLTNDYLDQFWHLGQK